jgi:uncharacterized protein (TIGR00251 family)
LFAMTQQHETRGAPDAWLQPIAGGAVLTARVTPRAARNALREVPGATMKIYLRAPPVDGKANAALIEFLAEILDVPSRRLSILTGERGRTKRIGIQGVSAPEVAARIARRLRSA